MSEPNQSLLLGDLSKVEKPSIIGFVRNHITEIREAQEKGHSYADIHQRLTQNSGLSFTLGTLAKYVQRIKREQTAHANHKPQLNVLPLPQKR